MSDREFKGTVKFVSLEKGKDTGNPYIKVSWELTEEKLDGIWKKVMPDDSGFQPMVNTAYTIQPEGKCKDGRSHIQMTKERLKEHFNFEGGIGDLDKIKGFVNFLVLHEVNGFVRVKYVNNPNGTKKTVCNIEKAQMDIIAKLFNRTPF